MGLRGEGEQRKAPGPLGVRGPNGTRGQVEVLASGDVSITFGLVGCREVVPGVVGLWGLRSTCNWALARKGPTVLASVSSAAPSHV